MLRHALSPMKTKNAAPGKYADGQGLWLHKRTKTAGRWFLRIVVNQKRREMGLGSWPDVSIAEAREAAANARRTLRSGRDPIVERQQQKFQSKKLTVAEAIDACFKARQAELKGDGKAGRWMSPLSVHIIPKIGDLAIENIDQHILKSVFDPIWHDKPSAARKAMNRMNLTFKHAAALDLDVDLQAVMKTKALLGKQRFTVTHIPSLPYADAPAFYKQLCQSDLVSAVALRFLMLTLARTSEVRFATFDEIQDDVWVLAPERTKTNRQHRIPLTDKASAIVRTARNKSNCHYLFPSPSGKPLSDAAMSAFMKREGMKARPHGMRATFRTWAENETDADWETKEMTLGHSVGTKVERAYQRSDKFESRRALLTQWADYLIA